MTIQRHRLILVASLLTASLWPVSDSRAAQTDATPDDLAWLTDYNIVWTTQSKDASESMPCGGADIGLNVWVENGDLLVYMQKSGCFDENNEYLKLGRLRVHLEPNPLADESNFRQELKLREGYVEVSGSKDARKTVIRVWVEVPRSVIHLEVDSNSPLAASVSYENWRTGDQVLPDDATKVRASCLSWDGYPGEVVRYHDEIRRDGNAVQFWHRNRDDKLLFDFAVRQQGLEKVKNDLVNTQKGRTFGGILGGDGFIPDGERDGKYLVTPFKAWRIRSDSPRTRHHVQVFSHVAQTDTLQQWNDALLAAARSGAPDIEKSRRQTQAWWADFWRRSRIVIAPGKPDEKNPAWQIARNYQLFRYQLGCNALGQYPTKFNGGNFTFDPVLIDKKRPNTPDFRAWGGGSFTAQNQRLVHWPMLKSGDADLMVPQLEFYRRALPSAIARVKAYYGHDGCLFVEQLENFGLPICAGWGWSESDAKVRQRGQEIPFGDPRADGSHGPKSLVEHGEQANAYVSYHYESQLEFSYMMLEYHRFSGADIRPYLPLIHNSVKFFDENYQARQKMRSGSPLDANGRLVIYPSTSCESYRGARNPADVIAGLSACLEGLLALDDALVCPADKEYYRAFQKRLPLYTIGEAGGERILLPAESYKRYQNVECPQFYVLFPFNRFALGRDDMTVFRNTWKHGKFPKNMVQSWHQDGIFFARMGMTTQARDYNIRKLENSQRRFPTFWGPGHDWTPDHNWGGSGMIGLQEMLMQTIGDKIILLPAWPKDWNCSFKLHAPGKTVVEGEVIDGKITRLTVTPESRRKDVVFASAQ